jgi:phycobilisome rod-core linker protein
MPLPLLEYAPSSQNQRVKSFEVPGDEQPRLYTTESVSEASEMSEVIEAAYRQIFHEQQMLSSNRQPFLESQLRFGQISVREFIRGLVLSDSFRRLNYEPNNNYRFAQLCVQRLLGRDVYNDREKLAWSIVLATEGLQGFVNDLINSNEYLENFGDHTVPYQRRRILPQRAQGDLPTARMPRYERDYLTKLQALGNDFSASRYVDSWNGASWLPPEPVRQLGAVLTYAYAGALSLIALATILSWFGWIQI